MASRKQVILFVLLALSVSAAVWVSEMPEHASEEMISSAVARPAAARREPATKHRSEDGAALALEKLQRSSTTVGDLNPFRPKSWYVAPPAPPPPPPSKPSAPPFPFSYVGKLQEEGGRWIVYLAKGEESYAVGKGETFDSVYRLEDIDNGNLVIQYLPLSTTQLLPIGSES